MRLSIDHRTTYRFTAPQGRVVQLLRVTPPDTHDQTVAEWHIAVDCDARVREHRDGFGNLCGRLTAPAGNFTIGTDAAIRDSGVKDLTIISNNAGIDDVGLGILLQTRQVRKMISSYVGENATFAKQFLAGELEIEFNPQGTLAERIRAGGAGIPAFYTATGAGTQIAEGKHQQEFDGRLYVMERGLRADLSVIHAWKSDVEGNLVYRKTARNFNPIMATAGETVVVQV